MAPLILMMLPLLPQPSPVCCRCMLKLLLLPLRSASSFLCPFHPHPLPMRLVQVCRISQHVRWPMLGRSMTCWVPVA